MRRLFRRLTARLSGPAGGVVAMASGSLVGQAVMAAATPFLSRIYPPSSFGAFSVIVAIATIVGPAATLKLESALLLPEDKDDARRLFRVGMASSVLVAVGTGAVVWIVELLGMGATWAGVTLAPLWIGAVVLATAVFTVLSQAALRSRSYTAVAKRSVSQSIGMVVGQLGLGFLTRGPMGLLGGYLLGRSIGFGPLLTACRDLLIRPGSGRYRDVLLRFWRFPLVFMPSALLNTLGSQLPLLVIAAWFGSDGAGQLGMAQRLVYIPLTLVGASVGQVFSAELSRRVRERRGENRKIYLRTSRHLALAALTAIIILLSAAPALFPWALGAEWADGGLFAQAMAVSVGLAFIASPTSAVYVIFQQSRASIMVDLSRIGLYGLAIAAIFVLHSDVAQAVWLLYAGQAINYLITWMIGLRIVTTSDRTIQEGA